MSKVSVFVGSSFEGLEVARSIQAQLTDESTEVELWNETVFGLGYGTLESLVQALNRFDFAVLVMTPDDPIMVHGVQKVTARDNVLIELGLFIGRLGRDRTFLVCREDADFKVPTDLAGITFATFSKPNDESKLITALGPACFRIRNAIRSLGKLAELKRLTQSVEEQGQRVQAQARQLEQQQEMINQLVKYSMSASIFHHLCGIAVLNEYLYHDDDATRRELYFLRDNGFIKPRAHAFVDFNHALDQANLVEVAEPTPIGWLCVKLRKTEMPTNMSDDHRNLRINLSTL
jgi:hypothetical protein